MRDYYVIIPENVNYKKLISSDIEKYGQINLNIVKGIIGYITKHTSYKVITHDLKNLDPNRLKVNLCSTKLKELFGNDYKLALELLHKRVLYKYPYSTEKCFSFALSPKMLQGGFRIEKLASTSTKDKNIIKKLIKNNNTIDTYTKSKFKYLIKFFNPNRLTIDFESAKIEIESHYEFTKNTSKQLINAQKLVDINNGVYNITHNPNSDGRFHNNLVRCNKALRKHIRYDGKRLAEIDISNSIPFILSSVLNKSIVIESKYLNSNKFFNHLSYMFQENAKSLDNKEIQLFHEKCANGSIYDSMSSTYKSTYINELVYELSHIDEKGIWHYDLPQKQARNLVKKEMLSMIFSKNSFYKVMQSIFYKSYPTILMSIKEIKKWRAKRLSHYLFQIESYVVLERLAKEFNNKNRGRILLFTIHDCLVTTEDNINLLHDFITLKLSEIFTDKQPNIKIKMW